jgi:outer membrane protein assembly factor BamD (BamD/ComL family)
VGSGVAAVVAAPGKGAGKEAPAGLDRELKLLAEARRAMRDGDTERALKLLEQHQNKHPGGALAEERAAARVLALCQSGKREDARSEAARFLALHPSSPMAARVRGACP